MGIRELSRDASRVIQEVGTTGQPVIVTRHGRPIADRVRLEVDPVALWVDPVRFRQVVRNLVSNAFRYGGDRVDIEVREAPGEVRLAVWDDGPGVPEADQGHLFEAFQRGADTGEPLSVGLGLSVSRQLARLMGGDVRYRREDRTIFELSLPLRSGSGTPDT